MGPATAVWSQIYSRDTAGMDCALRRDPGGHDACRENAVTNRPAPKVSSNPFQSAGLRRYDGPTWCVWLRRHSQSPPLPANCGARGEIDFAARAERTPQTEALFFGLERLEHLEAVGRLEVLVHHRMDGADHRLRRVRLKDVAAHVDARGALLDGVVGHCECLELGQFLAAGHHDVHRAGGGEGLEAVVQVVGLCIFSAYIGFEQV